MIGTVQISLLATLMDVPLALLGCGKMREPMKDNVPEPTVVEEIRVNGFDPEGEPVIKKWSDGTVWLHFEAMPPFFAEEHGNDAEFENFDRQIQNALEVPVTRQDREIFVIKNPLPDTVEKAKSWLEHFAVGGDAS